MPQETEDTVIARDNYSERDTPIDDLFGILVELLNNFNHKVETSVWHLLYSQ